MKPRLSISEHSPFYYTRQVCELDDFGCTFGFFESVLKSWYDGIFNCLNIKASISQKKFFLTTLQNFSNFFSKMMRLEVKVSHISTVSANNSSKLESKFLQMTQKRLISTNVIVFFTHFGPLFGMSRTFTQSKCQSHSSSD